MSPADGGGNRIVSKEGDLTWATLPALNLPSPAVVLVNSARQALAAVRWHALSTSEMLLAAEPRIDDDMCASLRADGFAIVRWTTGEPVVENQPTRPPERDRLWLLTSGSTGRPKRVAHTVASLTTVQDPQAPRVWLCAYSPGTYAWWQMVTLSLAHPNQDLVMVAPADLTTWPEFAARHGVTAASGTPTFWRRTIHQDVDALSRVPFEQITLGGEPVDQTILDQLAELFPDARISWIYASSEVGASIVVHDGRAGFPAAWLDQPRARGARLSVIGDELVIGSPHRAAGMEQVVRTGDRVQIIDDRVHIVGRLGLDEINVGGVKVSAAAVRDVLHSHPRVVWARVSARRAPLVGHVVVADVVTDPHAPAPDETELVTWCATRLDEPAVPRLIRFLERVPVKETLKSDS
jgi:acyl-coenzyme A synthetase/AMP-(fatty) acid ligase